MEIGNQIKALRARKGVTQEALAYYRKAMEVQKAPRYTDPMEAIAQYHEMRGEYALAISALQEELTIFETEWNFTEGESADVVRREIARLEKKLK